jgi:flagellar biosynthetic protein FlhB
VGTIGDTGKTEKATPKKKEDERKKGNIFQSIDITTAISVLGLFFTIRILGSLFFEFMKGQITSSLTSFEQIPELTQRTASYYIGNFAINTLLMILPLGIIASLIAIILTAAQTKLFINFDQIKPKFSRLNPLSGLKKIFTLKSLVNLFKSIILIIVIGYIIYTQVIDSIPYILKMINLNILYSLYWICDTIFGIVVRIAMFMMGFGLLDYFYQWWDYERQLRMTKQEIKDEYKQTEGDPEVKGKIKERQRKMSAMRMMEKVPTANVVIKNPTHYAVALKYNPKEDKAPVAVAKGKDYLALKIIEVAEKNNIIVTENRPLARGLYEAVEIDQEIPEEYYKAVADILAFIYNLKKGK